MISLIDMAKKEDRVNHPKPYTSHPSLVECITITRHYNFCIGNALKYLWRQGLKKEASIEDKAKQIEDCKKAIWYIQDHINSLEQRKEERDAFKVINSAC